MTVFAPSHCAACGMHKVTITVTPNEAEIIYRSLRKDNLIARKLREKLAIVLGLPKEQK